MDIRFLTIFIVFFAGAICENQRQLRLQYVGSRCSHY